MRTPGRSPAAAICPSMTGYACVISSLAEGVGYGHHRLDYSRPGRRFARRYADPRQEIQGLILTCVIGIAGALLGGWAATKLFHIHSLQGFFNLSTWITAIVGAAVLLLAFHLITSRSGRVQQGPTGPAGPRYAHH